MHGFPRQVIASVLLLVQLVLCVAPSGGVLCVGLGPCGAQLQQERAGETKSACCGRCDKDGGAAPAPAPVPTECPPGCDCCIDVAVADQVARLDTQSAAAELELALAAAFVTVAVLQWPEPCELLAARACWSPPPDRPLQSAAVGLESTRLVI